MKNSRNQIRAKMISKYPKTDPAKLAGLERFLHEKFPNATVVLEAYLIFTKGEDEYIGWKISLSEESVKQYKIHNPDVLLFLNQGMIILELDGPIHDKKTWKTSERDRVYGLNNFRCRVVNETNLKFELDVAKSADLSQDQINQAFWKKLTDNDGK